MSPFHSQFRVESSRQCLRLIVRLLLWQQKHMAGDPILVLPIPGFEQKVRRTTHQHRSITTVIL